MRRLDESRPAVEPRSVAGRKIPVEEGSGVVAQVRDGALQNRMLDSHGVGDQVAPDVRDWAQVRNARRHIATWNGGGPANVAGARFECPDDGIGLGVVFLLGLD